MRHDQALIDHAEADAARQLVDAAAADSPAMNPPQPTLSLAEDGPVVNVQPAPIDFDSAFPDYDSEAT